LEEEIKSLTNGPPAKTEPQIKQKQPTIKESFKNTKKVTLEKSNSESKENEKTSDKRRNSRTTKEDKRRKSKSKEEPSEPKETEKAFIIPKEKIFHLCPDKIGVPIEKEKKIFIRCMYFDANEGTEKLWVTLPDVFKYIMLSVNSSREKFPQKIIIGSFDTGSNYRLIAYDDLKTLVTSYKNKKKADDKRSDILLNLPNEDVQNLMVPRESEDIPKKKKRTSKEKAKTDTEKVDKRKKKSVKVEKETIPDDANDSSGSSFSSSSSSDEDSESSGDDEQKEQHQSKSKKSKKSHKKSSKRKNNNQFMDFMDQEKYNSLSESVKHSWTFISHPKKVNIISAMQEGLHRLF